jgi:cholesterol oxidase
MDFDVIVIGSGFGGAITACRLAEAGYKVCILERGRRWNKDTYPRKPDDPWIWSYDNPEKQNGWLDLRVFPNMSVAQGAGVGGGSLIYANVSVEPPPDIFQAGWPPEITYAELKPHYDRVAKFMNVQKVPDKQWNPRMHMMKEGAEKTGHGDRFKLLPLAISFDPELTYDADHPPPVEVSKRFINAQGVEQGTCVHLGTCDIGCKVDARNTLDLNYIPWAEKHGAQVRPLHLVNNIEQVAGGFRVSFDRLENRKRVAGSVTARIVIVAAGSLGSTELLLRCRNVTKSLSQLSAFAGRNWSSNGDFLTPAIYAGREIHPTRGPTISTAIDFLDRSEEGQSFWIEDGGFPDLLGYNMRRQAERPPQGAQAEILIASIRDALRRDPFTNVMPWFAQAVDKADGTLSLKRKFFNLFGAHRLHLSWNIAESEPAITAVVNMHLKLSAATNGKALVPPGWALFRDLITPHPLGGCNMGSTAATGAVSHRGEAFGYKNLYVADAAIIPEALGVNPSRTIGALAERIAKIIIEEGR